MLIDQQKEFKLQEQAQSIRSHIVNMISKASSGHPGGSLSAADILTVLYFDEMLVNPEQPNDPNRDRFVLSKGHASPVLYATLAEKGFFPKEELLTFRQINSRLQGHPSRKHLPGVDMSTGSLGQGLSAAIGMALTGRLDGRDYRVYALLGDGEMQEGMVWEALMSAAHYKLDNLTVFLDYNQLQIDGYTAEVMSIDPIADKVEAFGWDVLEIDGHDYAAISRAIAEAKLTKGKPTFIIAHTVKGKGVSFMENRAEWHGVAPSFEQKAAALRELAKTTAAERGDSK